MPIMDWITCDSYTKQMVRNPDFNFDGFWDEITKVVFDQDQCPGREPRIYVTSGGQDLDMYQSEYKNLSVGLTQISAGLSLHHPFARNFSAAAKPGGTAFRWGDFVEGPFGPFDEKTRGRIDDFIFEFDASHSWVRTVARIHTDKDGFDYFDLSALTLIEPLVMLDQEGDAIAKEFKEEEASAFGRRREILSYADFSDLKTPLKEEVKKIEDQLFKALEKKIASQDIDIVGQELLMEQLPEKLDLRRSIDYSAPVWSGIE